MDQTITKLKEISKYMPRKKEETVDEVLERYAWFKKTVIEVKKKVCEKTD